MHDEALTKQSKILFDRFDRFSGFYLAGGTALALQIGHRISVDFDLFTDHELSPRLLAQVKRVFRGSQIMVTYRVPGQLNLVVDGVKITFFQYDYPPVLPLVGSSPRPMLAIKELAATKAFAIGKRLAYKDYVDWYFLLRGKHVTLSETITLARQKYRGDFNDRLFLGQLASFTDVDTTPIDFLGNEVARETIQYFLETQVKDFPYETTARPHEE